MMKDKRKKGCPNQDCKRNKKKKRFAADNESCPDCGEKLVFVCKRCFGPIEDEDIKHRKCASCEAKAKDRKDKVVGVAKKGGLAIGGLFATGVGLVLSNKDEAKELAADAIEAMKK